MSQKVVVFENAHQTEDTTKESKVKVKKYLREFSDVTSLHGVRYVGEENSHFMERLCWVFAILACTAFCGIEIRKVWYRWQNAPVIISFEQSPTNVASIPFPALTICPENKVRKSVMDMDKEFHNLEAKLNGTKKFESYDARLLAEAVSLACINSSRDMSLALPHDFVPTSQHMKLLAENISLQIEDIFYSCYFENIMVDCKSLFRPILTLYGLCYTFNTLDPLDFYTSSVDRTALDVLQLVQRKSSWDPELGYSKSRSRNDFPIRSGVYVGPRMGIEFTLKIPAKEIQDICTMQDADSLRLTVQSPTEFPDPFYDNYFYVSAGSKTSIALRPNTVTTSPALRSYTPQLRGCNFPDDKQLKLFRTYSQHNCITECENEVLRKYCGCQLSFMPLEKNDNVSYCSATTFIPKECDENFLNIATEIFYSDVEERLDVHGEAAACDCLPSCSELNYEFHVGHDVFKTKLSDTETDVQFAVVTMYFEAPSFLGKHRSELYGVTDFIASCGGLLGLFTGFSVITAIEIFYFASLRICCKLRRQRQVIHQVDA